MGVSIEVDLCNIALQRLGQAVISTMTENSRDALICNQLYDQNRDYCLMLADWDCLINRQTMTRAGQIAITGATAADPVVVSCTGHLFIANELVTIEDAGGMTELNNNIYRIYAYTSGTITLYGTDGDSIDGTSYTAYTSGGYVYRDASANWSYVYDVPSNCLRILKILDDGGGEDDSYTWKTERTFIYCDLENAGLEYLKQETDPGKYQSDLVEVIAARLAWYISMRIHSDKALRNEVYNEMNAAIGRAKMTNARGKEADEEPAELWSGVF